MEHANRRRFDARMGKLDHDLLCMAAAAEQMMALAMEAMAQLDPSLARKAIEMDDKVDAWEVSIEHECHLCLALEHPMGVDLRRISGILKMVSDIEQYADIAVELAKTALQLEQEMEDPGLVDLPLMGSCVRKMLLDVIHCYAHEDHEGLDSLVDLEDQVDELYRRLKSQIIERLSESRQDAVAGALLLLAAHLLERAGDLCLSLGDKVLFILTSRLHGLSPTHRPQLVVEAAG